MAIYTPKKVGSGSRKGSGTSRSTRTLAGLFRRKHKGPPQRTQVLVSGTQRLWKLKRISQTTALVVVVVAVIALLLWGGAHLLLQSTIFRLTDIRVLGNRVTTQRQILDLAGLQQGGSLLKFNGRAAAARIKAHPWVEEVEIKTHWPSAVEIRVSEFQPFALVNVEAGQESRLRYLSQDGRLFAEVGEGQELDFPVITGVGQAEISNEHLIRGSLADSARHVLQLAARGNAILPIQGISEVHVDSQAGLILYLVDRPFPIRFGHDRLQTKYYRLVRVLEQLYAKKQVDDVKEIRMDYLDDKVLVTGAKIDG